MYVSREMVKEAAKDATVHPYGFQYVLVRLSDGDRMTNPASTKRDVYGPGLWLWELHQSGITVREYDVEREISRELRAGAGVIPS